MQGNSLFGAVKLTKNADLDKYRCSGYSIRFDASEVFCYLMVVSLVKT